MTGSMQVHGPGRDSRKRLIRGGGGECDGQSACCRGEALTVPKAPSPSFQSEPSGCFAIWMSSALISSPSCSLSIHRPVCRQQTALAPGNPYSRLINQGVQEHTIGAGGCQHIRVNRVQFPAAICVRRLQAHDSLGALTKYYSWRTQSE